MLYRTRFPHLRQPPVRVPGKASLANAISLALFPWVHIAIRKIECVLFLPLWLFLSLSTISGSAADDPMEVQRCVWRCLANAKGADDPAYERCVKKYCAEGQTATEQKKNSKKKQ